MSMFSSFTQFLPSAIQNTIAQHQPPPPIAEEAPPPQSCFDPSTDDEGDEEELLQRQSQQMEEQQDDRRKVKSKKERDIPKMANEVRNYLLSLQYIVSKQNPLSQTFIFVRPPPSKSNHPLNLQVQLVPPSNRDRDTNRSSGRRSRDSSVGPEVDDGASDVQLTRTSSNRSDVSMYSSYSSTSISSMASTSTASSGRRMIIPLYNLQAHSVLTNTILDAGTDAKVAKFQKRGLEVIGLALLEIASLAPTKGHITVCTRNFGAIKLC